MNILVITFYKGDNPGTFMQAFGVQTALKKAFPNSNIELLNCPNYKKNFRANVKSRNSILSTIIQKSFSLLRKFRYNILIKKIFKITSYSLDLFNYNEVEVLNLFSKYDLISIGSDTILEKIKDPDGKIGLNWGPNFIENKKIYFAASAAPANFNLTENEITQIKNCVLPFSFIGIRDLLTISFLTDEIGIDANTIVKQPDPTYFIDISSFKLNKFYTKILSNKKKIALFNFNNYFPYRKELSELLKNEGYTLVSSAMYNNHADISLGFLHAFEWAGVFKICDLVVTERFHDSLFALRNCKPVISIDWDETRFSSEKDSKTYRILEDYDLLDCHFNIKSINELPDIIYQVKSLEINFNTSKIEQINNRYINYSIECLELITKQANNSL